MQSIQMYYLSVAPSKIVERADLYSKTLEKNVDLPKDINKSIAVKSKVEQQKEHIIYAIEAAKYQQELYKSKQSRDLETRHNYEQKIREKQVKNMQKMKQNYKIKTKKAENFNKNLIEVGKRYLENQEKKRNNEKDQSLKLRKQLLEFYQKEKMRKLKAEKSQISVSSCYKDAVQRINQIHRKNQEYSFKTATNLEQELGRNNKFQQKIDQKIKSLSIKNKQKEQVYIENLSILQDKQLHFIQKCGKNEDGYLSAWDKIGKTIGQMRKKRGQQAKRNLDSWRQRKTRIDQSKLVVSQRCLTLIDKTSKAAFKRTMSSFRTTARSFDQSVQKNKKVIKQKQDKRKDQIIDLHLDIRLLNTSSAKITERMHSMRQNASLLTYQL